MLRREALGVLGEHLVPLGLGSSTVGSMLSIVVVHLLGDDEALLRVEAELLLEFLDVVSLEGRAVDTSGTLVLRAVANGGLELNERGLVLDSLALLDGRSHGSEVIVTVVDGHDMPAIRLVPLDNVLSEGAVGVAVNGDLVVVPDRDEVTELKMTSERASLARDTLHQATITEEAVRVVVDDREIGLVEDGSGVGLGHSKANCVGDALAKRAGGDLDTRRIVSLGMTRSNAVYFLLTGRGKLAVGQINFRKMTTRGCGWT